MTQPIPIRVVAPLLAGILSAQTPAPPPAFEVASIRPASPPTPETLRSGQFHAGAKIDAAHLDFGYISLGDLLPYAFRVKPYQISAPSWTRDSRWNILANLPSGVSQDQVPEMMQALLADRFKLAIHREKREQAVYQLCGGARRTQGGGVIRPAANIMYGTEAFPASTLVAACSAGAR